MKVPRSLDDVFRRVKNEQESQGGPEGIRLHVSYVEVYKDELRDLLAVEGYADGGGGQIQIREDENGLTG